MLSEREPPLLHTQREGVARITQAVILLVEDNADDEELTLRAFKKSNITNKVIVTRDGAAALEYLFASGTYAGRDPQEQPRSSSWI